MNAPLLIKKYMIQSRKNNLLEKCTMINMARKNITNTMAMSPQAFLNLSPSDKSSLLGRPALSTVYFSGCFGFHGQRGCPSFVKATSLCAALSLEPPEDDFIDSKLVKSP